MSENIDSILGISEVKQEDKPQKQSVEEVRVTKSCMIDLKKGDNNAESILSFVAYTVLVFGLFISIILSCYVGHKGKALDGWKLFLGMAFGCSIVWAGSMILINISNNIRSIKHLLARQQGLSIQDELNATTTSQEEGKE